MGCSIDHIPCKNIPDGLDEDTFILIYRKQHAALRHKIFKYYCEAGTTRARDPIVQAE